MMVFLFTDIEGSTRLWEQDDAAMAAAMAQHNALMAEQLAKYGGRLVKHTGEGIFAVFTAGRPLHIALAVQEQLPCQDWGAIQELRVRIALHAGQAQQRNSDYPERVTDLFS